jgi:hypothetical protein
LAPSEADAAADRTGLRIALHDGLTARHFTPLAAFVLAIIFASTLALTDLISRRLGEAALLLAAAAFMLQRLVTHWRIRRARREGRAAIAELRAAAALTASFGSDNLCLEVDGQTTCHRYAECDEAEDAGGLIYVWLRSGIPIVIPTRALCDQAEAARLVSDLSSRIRESRGATPAY